MKARFPMIAMALTTAAIACYCSPSPRWLENKNRQMTGAPEQNAIPPDLLEDNMKTTRYTYLVFIEKAMVTGERGGPPKTYGYVNHVYNARVIEVFKGPKLDRVTYSVMADADIKPSLPAWPMIVSLCGSEKEGFYVPDNGYVSPAVDSLVAKARRLSKKNTGPDRGKGVCAE